MIRFESDYLEGALPEVMRALNETNYVQTPATARTNTAPPQRRRYARSAPRRAPPSTSS